MTERVVPERPGPAGPAELYAAARRRGLALRGYALQARAGPAADKPLLKNLITNASVAGTA